MSIRFLPLLLAGSLTLLAACGGAEDQVAGDPSAAQEIVAGKVSGFGSIVVDGVTYDDENATVEHETSAGVFEALPPSAVELGMQVEVDASGDRARSLTIQTTLIAAIESLRSDGFVAAGQTVVIGPDTLYLGAAGLVDLQIGDWVAVHGTRDADDSIQADRVAVRAPEAPRLVRIAGIVRDLDEARSTFRIGRLLVDYSSDTRIVPAGAQLADGRAVVVFADGLPQAGVLEVRGIRVLRAGWADGRRVRVAGLVRDLDAQALSFRLFGTTVDASAARFANLSPTDLANGRRVRVLGTIRVTADGERSLVAETVWALGGTDDLTTVAGPVRNAVGAASFTIRGVTIDASGDSVRFIGGSAEQIADGVWLRVIGDPAGDRIVATTIEFRPPFVPTPRSGALLTIDALEGVIYRIESDRFLLNGIVVQVDAGGAAASTVATLRAGHRVRVSGVWTGGLLRLTTVTRL